MYLTKIKHISRLLFVLTITGLALTSASVVKASDGPELPAQCGSLQIPDGNKLTFHAFARGVQIYRWNGNTWDFVAPMATLFAEENYFGEVGIHYVGPTWESRSGSKVVGRRVPGTGCTPDPSALPWLLLESTETSGAGIFGSVTYIQRVNTSGGVAPAAPGTTEGEVQQVAYTAEYYFYRAQH